MIKKSTIISWSIPLVIVVVVLIIFFNQAERTAPPVTGIDCEKRMPDIVENYPDYFDNLEQAIVWCNICNESNSVPTLAERGAFCNPITSDGQKRCLDSDECEGYCIGGNASTNAGHCSETKYTIGCFYEMADGQAIEVCKY